MIQLNWLQPYKRSNSINFTLQQQKNKWKDEEWTVLPNYIKNQPCFNLIFQIQL